MASPMLFFTEKIDWRILVVWLGPKFAGVLIFIAGLAIYLAFSWVMEAIEFDEVEATVTGNTLVCERQPAHPLYNPDDRPTSCGEMGLLANNGFLPENIYRSREIAFTFVSPVDGQTHTGTVPKYYSQAGNRGARQIAIGARGRILASASIAHEYEARSWDFLPDE